MTDIITSENLLIGAALLSSQTAKYLITSLRPTDFSVEANCEVFEAMQRIDGRGEEIDAAKAANESGADRQYLYELMEIAPSGSADLEPHITEVRKAALARCARCNRCGRHGAGRNTDPSEVIDNAVQALGKLAEHAEGERSPEKMQRWSSGNGWTAVQCAFRPALQTLTACSAAVCSTAGCMCWRLVPAAAKRRLHCRLQTA
ncbi:MAG: DnaB-like helicase N-terminal domain-containing protein [Butyricicoccus sp.]